MDKCDGHQLPQRILIAGLGNIFFGDDAFGVEVVRRLSARPLPPEVRVVDFGIRGLDLTYALLDGYETVILVDAVPRGQPPGTLYVIEPQCVANDGTPTTPVPDSHGMDPVNVLRLVQQMGGTVSRVLLVGCEPSPEELQDVCEGLTAPVEASLEPAVTLIESLLSRAGVACFQPSDASDRNTVTSSVGQ